MKFLYYGSFGPHNTESYITHALKSLGHSVDQADRQNCSVEALLQSLKNNQYDVLLFTKTPANFYRVLDTAKEVGTKTVCWLFDLYWGWRANPESHSMWKADYVFTTDGGHDDMWKKHGINHKTLRQGIHFPHHYAVEGQKGIDVAFVGSPHYPDRVKLIKHLKRRYNFKLIQNVRGENLNNKLAQIKIVVGDSVPSPKYWSNRVYEITGRGGFLIHPEVEGFKREFPTVPTFPYGDFKAIDDLIGHYLQNVNARNALKKEQFENGGLYTYTGRAKKLCEHISS